MLKRSRARYPFVEHAFADGGYAGRLINWTRQKTHITLQIVRRNTSTKGFKVLPRGWVVERTFAWIIKNRRFVRDYEQLTSVAETLIIIIAAAATLMLTRCWGLARDYNEQRPHCKVGWLTLRAYAGALPGSAAF